MQIVNSSEEKRNNASKKIKILWKTEEYKEKTNTARNAAIRTSEARAKNSKHSQKRWSDPDYKEMMLEKRRGYYKLISPNKEIFFTHDLEKFCLINQLNKKMMSYVCRGKQSLHNGWGGIKITKEEYETI